MMIVCRSIMQHNVTGRRPELLLNATTCLLRPNIQCQSTTNKCTHHGTYKCRLELICHFQICLKLDA